jgi:hypothetical protein
VLPPYERCRRWIFVAAIVSGAVGCAGRESKPAPPATAQRSGPPAVSSGEAGAVETVSDSEERDRECGATVQAPIDVTRRALTNYEHYATILPRFGRSRVLKRTQDSADVYLQVPILRGAAHLWGVVRFVGPTLRPDGERIEGNYLHEGNVSAFHCLWTYRPVDEAHTELHLGLLLLPKIPLPESVIDSELNDACKDAVQGVKSYVEARGP